jgi:hypothetical protein
VLHRPIAAFRVLRYFARSKIPLPDDFMDIDTNRLRQMKETQGGEEDVDF